MSATIFMWSHFFCYFSVNSVYFPQTFLFCNSYYHCHLLSSCINSLLLSLTFQYNGCLHYNLLYILLSAVNCQYKLWHNAVSFVDKNISKNNAASSFRDYVLSIYLYQPPRLCGATTQKAKSGYLQLWKPKNVYMCYMYQHCLCVTGSFINIHIETKAGSLWRILFSNGL